MELVGLPVQAPPHRLSAQRSPATVKAEELLPHRWKAAHPRRVTPCRLTSKNLSCEPQLRKISVTLLYACSCF